MHMDFIKMGYERVNKLELVQDMAQCQVNVAGTFGIHKGRQFLDQLSVSIDFLTTTIHMELVVVQFLPRDKQRNNKMNKSNVLPK